MALLALLDNVHSHLQEVRKDPSRGLNEKLLEHVDRQVTGMRRLISGPWPHCMTAPGDVRVQNMYRVY